MSIFCCRYRDGIGRWTVGHVRAATLAHAHHTAIAKFGECAAVYAFDGDAKSLYSDSSL
jgi:hypothetical protein